MLGAKVHPKQENREPLQVCSADHMQREPNATVQQAAHANAPRALAAHACWAPAQHVPHHAGCAQDYTTQYPQWVDIHLHAGR